MKKITKIMCLTLLSMILFSGAVFADSDETVIEDFTPVRGDKSPAYKDREQDNDGAAEDTAASPVYSWYFKKTSGGQRPPIASEMSFIEDYNGYFLGKDEKVIYLTFDAGYENGNVEKILDVLKEKNVPGAFFILDNLVLKNTELVVRMADEGHTVCNHTAKHRDMSAVQSKDEFAEELNKMAQIYKDTTGYDMAMYYRPPEGKYSEENMQWANELGYKTIFWSFAYADWDNNAQPDPAKAKEKILSSTHNGEVILLHPTSATNAAILSDLIDEWTAMGYRFGTLDELTGVTDGK